MFSSLRGKYFSDSSEYLKKKEKYSLIETEQVIKSLLEQDFRDIQKLPPEFHKFSNILIRLQNPVEPEDYECCGKGCTPCVWTIYDEKVQKLDDVINDIYEQINTF